MQLLNNVVQYLYNIIGVSSVYKLNCGVFFSTDSVWKANIINSDHETRKDEPIVTRDRFLKNK